MWVFEVGRVCLLYAEGKGEQWQATRPEGEEGARIGRPSVLG